MALRAGISAQLVTQHSDKKSWDDEKPAISDKAGVPPSQTTNHHVQSFSCFLNSDEESSCHFWKTPVKFFHVAARELSVLLILIETLILLGGYLMILGVHHSIRYCLSKLRHKAYVENVPYMNMRNNYHLRPVIARRVPRGRMAGG